MRRRARRALAARFAPPSKNFQLRQQRDRAEVAAAAEIVMLALDAAVDTERDASVSRSARASCTRDSAARVARSSWSSSGRLASAAVRRVARSCTARETSRLTVAGISSSSRGVIAKEVDVAARLRLTVACFAQLLDRRRAARRGAQHLVLRDLAVAEQAIRSRAGFLRAARRWIARCRRSSLP